LFTDDGHDFERDAANMLVEPAALLFNFLQHLHRDEEGDRLDGERLDMLQQLGLWSTRNHIILGRRVHAALRLVPPVKFRSDSDTGRVIDVLKGRALSTYNHSREQQEERHAILQRTASLQDMLYLARACIECDRVMPHQVPSLGTVCPKCFYIEKATARDPADWETREGLATLCEFCGEWYLRAAKVCFLRD